MAIIEQHPPSTFCWADLGTTDAEAAKQFYTRLFGWDYHDLPMEEGTHYTMLRLGGDDVAALYPLGPAQAGQPPAWNVYVAVDDVDEVAGKVEELGGSVLAWPCDVFDAGRMALLKDPTGAVLALWQARSHIGARRKDEPGAMCWAELATSNAARARSFYTDLFGWTPASLDMGGYPYTSFMKGDLAAGGMFQMTQEWGDTPPHWLLYFAVEDCEDAVRRAEALGAAVLTPATEVPSIGRFAILRDPQGAAFALLAPYQAP